MDFEDEDIFNDDLDLLEIIEYGFPRKIYQRNEHFEELDELTFFRRFRLMKNTVYNILTLIENDLEYPHDLNNSVSPINLLLTTLRFYASAGHLASIADFISMDVATASRIIARVSLLIARLYPRYIKMPVDEHIVRTQTDFFNVASFPKVIACVDGTHVRIQSPGGDDAEIYRNRKGYFSINTQVACNSELKMLDLEARWPGSVHDCTIFNNSRLKLRFENIEFPNSIVLGDSGYVARQYVLTPLANPILRSERLYNESHIRTRNCIERCIGVWERRFPIIAYGMRLKLQTVMHIIIATAVLHNVAKEMNEDDPPLAENLYEEELNYLIEMGEINVPNPNDDVPQNFFRNQLINNFFSQL